MLGIIVNATKNFNILLLFVLQFSHLYLFPGGKLNLFTRQV